MCRASRWVSAAGSVVPMASGNPSAPTARKRSVNRQADEKTHHFKEKTWGHAQTLRDVHEMLNGRTTAQQIMAPMQKNHCAGHLG